MKRGAKMNKRLRRTAFICLGMVLSFALAAPLSALGPTIEHHRIEERFLDDFVLELCGIETFTTLTQSFTVKVIPDGSEQVHVVRTFVPEDPRIPLEQGAATTFVTPDGTRTVIGKPIQLFGPDGGVRLLDAGLVTFGEGLLVRGPHPSLEVDNLAPFYCPSGN
jgi:hypothetical protein